MSETRYRANLLSATVDEIVIVNENTQFVDVRYDRSYSGVAGAIVRREGKVTAYSQVCKTKTDAWLAIKAYAEDQLIAAEAAMDLWTGAAQIAERYLAQQTD